MEALKNYIDDALVHCNTYDSIDVRLHFFNVGYKMCLEKIKSIIDSNDTRSTDGEVHT